MARQIISGILLMASLNSCYYDNKEDLFIGEICQTENLRFEQDIQSIVNTSCAFSGCHDSSTKSAGIDLSSYSEVVKVNDVQLLGAIKQESGYIAMPLGASKLPDCQINKIQRWIEDGKQP